MREMLKQVQHDALGGEEAVCGRGGGDDKVGEVWLEKGG